MHLGKRDFLLQTNWVNDDGGSCQLSYTPDALPPPPPPPSVQLGVGAGECVGAFWQVEAEMSGNADQYTLSYATPGNSPVVLYSGASAGMKVVRPGGSGATLTLKGCNDGGGCASVTRNVPYQQCAIGGGSSGGEQK